MPDSPPLETSSLEPAHLAEECRPSGGVSGLAASAGLEIHLYDPNRRPQNWTDCMRPDQCAVLFKDRATSAPLSSEGKPYTAETEYTCFLFDHLDAAQRFCETRVNVLPSLVCEIFNSEGRAKPPLVVIAHPDYERGDDSGPATSRRRRLIAAGLFIAAAALFSVNWWGENTLATFLACNGLLFGSRFVFWEYAVKHREQERRRRLEAHRRIERGNA